MAAAVRGSGGQWQRLLVEGGGAEMNEARVLNSGLHVRKAKGGAQISERQEELGFCFVFGGAFK